MQVDSKANGEEVDGSKLKSEPVASVVASDEADLDDDGLDLSKSTLTSIKEGGRSLCEKIGDLFDLKTEVLRKDIKAGNASLKADNKNLRLDFEKTTHALRVEIDNVTARSCKAIMKHGNELDVRIKKG